MSVFGEENFKYYLDMGFSRPRFISTNPLYLYQSGLSEFQLKFYQKMYRIRMVEQKRFDKNVAWMAKELQKFHQLQKELDELKAEKKEIKDNLKLVEGCKKELQQFTMLDLVSIEEKVSNTVQVPEYTYGDERTETVMDVVENSEHEPVVQDSSQEDLDAVTATSVFAEYDLDVVGNVEVLAEAETNAEEYVEDKYLAEAELTDVDESMDKSVNYESFMSMSPEDMAGILKFDRIVGIDEVHSKVSSFFRDVKSDVDGNEIMDVAKLVYKGMRANFIKQRAEEIVEAINSMGLSYPRLTDKEKAELFRFLPDDNNYNLELHMAVLKVCGMKLEFDEVYEDYQRIYDKTMEMQGEKKNERGESGRGRAR